MGRNGLAHKVQHIVVMLYNMSKLTVMLIVFGHTQDPSGLSLQNSDPGHLHNTASAKGAQGNLRLHRLAP